MKLTEFFQKHPVFTIEELREFLENKGSRNPWTRKALIAHHRKQGRIFSVRRGLYVAVPPGVDPSACPVDPYLLAAKITHDAILAYHTALEFHGKAYAIYEQFFYLTRQRSLPLTFRSHFFRSVRFPKMLLDKHQEHCGVSVVDRAGVRIRVTSLERTLVDVLDRPNLGGSWEEIWRSLESVEFFDLDKVVEYALLLENATTIAKVGFFLEQHQRRLMVDEGHLRPLRERRPQKPHYMVRSPRRSGHFIAEWHLVVPTEVLERSWEAVT